MIPLIGLLLCVHLIFKGIEILQISLASPRRDVGSHATLGAFALVMAIVIAGVFALLFLLSGASTPSLQR